jgi:flavin-dependent dehydrogenase
VSHTAVESPQSTRLRDGDSVAVVGGGPAGAFFAIQLLKKASEMNRRLLVSIIEKKRPAGPMAEPWHCKGCNACAGGISPRLTAALEQIGIPIPEEIVQSEIEHIWLHGLWKNFPFKVPADCRMYSVFRGSLPSSKRREFDGFDGFLLKQAVDAGAHLIHGEVTSIDYSATGLPTLDIKSPAGGTRSIEANFVTVATGINSRPGQDYSGDHLMGSVQRLIPRFQPASTRKALLVELKLGHEYLRKNMHREMHFLEHGVKRLALEHVALVPKDDHLTVTLIGKRIDEAEFPADTTKIIQEFLRIPQISRILPGITGARVACACSARMAISTAKQPFGDRLGLIGDTVGSRLYKDGLYSAHLTAEKLAETVLRNGIDRQSLATGYAPLIRWMAKDNRYGKRAFALSKLTFGRPGMDRILYQAYAIELRERERDKRPVGDVLWKIASGMADYEDLFKEMLRLNFWWSILVNGLLVTIRNVITEIFFGLSWEECGRYPTIIVKEKRQAVIAGLSTVLRKDLDKKLEFDRMHIIKIKATPEQIFKELGLFGDPGRHFFNLRFLGVERISGTPNEEGSTIQYSFPLVGFATEMQLTKRIENKLLFYDVSEKFVNKGKLVFEMNPTKDGNCRLIVYSAFDFKAGNGFVSRLFWKLVKLLFPTYVHDLVWNHALCNIKGNLETTP